MKPYDYTTLIKKFLNREITVQEFERTYLDEFINEKVKLNEFFDPLDWLFAEIDAFTDLPFESGEKMDDYIDENQLRASAKKTLREIEKLGWK